MCEMDNQDPLYLMQSRSWARGFGSGLRTGPTRAAAEVGRVHVGVAREGPAGLPEASTGGADAEGLRCPAGRPHPPVTREAGSPRTVGGPARPVTPGST